MIRTGPVRIVPQLRLHLAVRLTVYQYIGAGGDGAAHIGQACALLDHRVVVLPILQRLRRGHEEALAQLPQGEVFLTCQSGFLQVLGHQSRHTGNLGSGHGGTGHGLVALPTGDHAVDGVNVAAGSGDLRLQLQGAGNAPAGKIAHGVGLVVNHGTHILGNG